MNLRKLFLFFGFIMPAIFVRPGSVMPPIAIPANERLISANDSLWRHNFISGETMPTAQEVKNSASFYGSPHLLQVKVLTPEPLPPRPVSDWVLWAVILSLGALSVSKFFYPHRTRQIIRATLGGRHFKQMEREGNLFDETPTWLLFSNFMIIISLLIKQTLLQFNLSPPLGEAPEILLFALAMVFLVLYYPIKASLTGFLAWVFKTKNANNIYYKNIFLYNNFAGIVLLPFVVFNVYNHSMAGLLFSWIILLLINLIKFFRGAAIGYSQAGFSVYYLILYLCAVELAPLLILAKAMSRFLLPG